MSARVRTGAGLLVLTVTYYIAELVVGGRWSAAHPYSWADNMISDLGVPECFGDMARYGAATPRYICSPWHALMSAEFVLLGVLVFAAALLLVPLLPKTVAGQSIPVLAAINCVGMVLVGVFPGSAGEVPGGNQLRAVLHPAGAYLELLSGLAIMIIVARLFRVHSRYAATTLVLIAVTAFGMVASLAPNHLGLGAGAAERLAIDPFVVWRIVTGVVVLVASGSATSRRNGLSA
ncbi:putative membrane protein [Nocardia tenerifensis]|uniref:Putative membrane protein n=1 Tax=Nocardia tenerifensis TaxID=228006 RepID=A0A318K9X4_9NOCA|nr:putative membrane protein [Nocardia tenerifensis]